MLKNRKMDLLSKVVAFITALAIAMLTVTLVHRTVIYADQLDDAVTDSASETTETVSVSTEDMSVSVTDAEEAAETEDPPGVSDETSDISDAEAVTEADGGAVPNFGIMLLAEGEDNNTEPTYLDAEGIVIFNRAQILRENYQELKAGTNVRDGDKLILDFEWYIPDDGKDYSNVIFELDITDKLMGIELPDKLYPYVSGGEATAEYRIVHKDDDGNVRTVIQIAPQQGFGEGSSDRHGSVLLDGTVNTSDFKAGDPNITLGFFDATVDVVAPGLESNIFAQKWATGSVRPVETANGTEYYQTYTIRVTNNGATNEEAVVIDIPGDLFASGPQNVKIKRAGSNTEEDLAADKMTSYTDANGKTNYQISAGTVSAGNNWQNPNNYVDITYEMKLDTTKLFGDISSVDTTNQVSMMNSDGTSKYPENVTLDISSVRPKIEKNGTYDQATNKITWTITVHGNIKEGESFTITDTPVDASGNARGDAFTISSDNSDVKEILTEKGEHTYVYTYTYTETVPTTASNNETYCNDAVLEYDDFKTSFRGQCTIHLNADIVSKSYTVDNNTLKWTATVTIPNNYNNSNPSLTISDGINVVRYDGDVCPTVTYSDIFININGTQYKLDNNDKQNANHIDNSGIGYGGIHEKGFTIFLGKTWDDTDTTMELLKETFKPGNIITITYNTTFENIDLVGKCTNNIECTLSGYDTDKKSVVYAKDFDINKNSGTWNLSWFYNEYKDVLDLGSLRNKIDWAVVIDDFNGIDPTKNNQIKVEDVIDENYTFFLSDSNESSYFIRTKIVSQNGTVKDLANKPHWTVTATKAYCALNLTAAESKLLSEGGRIEIGYFSQMTEEHYQILNSLTGEQTYENNVAASLNGGKWLKSSAIGTSTPDNTHILNKIADYNPDKDTDINKYNANYTLEVNKAKMKLGDKKTYTVTDTLGRKLEFDEEQGVTIKRNGVLLDLDKEENIKCDYNKKTATLTFILPNDEQTYEITYFAKVTQLYAMEYLETDGIYDDMDNKIINSLFGNDAVLSYSDNEEDNIAVHKLIDNCHSRATIHSAFQSTNPNNKDSTFDLYLQIRKKWDDTKRGGKVTHTEPVVVEVVKYDSKGTPLMTIPFEAELNSCDGEYIKVLPGLPRTDETGKEYIYKVIGESNTPVGYVASFGEMTQIESLRSTTTGEVYNHTYEIVVTNTYTGDSVLDEKVNLEVSKEWVGGSNPPDSITFKLKQDDEYYDDKVYTITAENGWKAVIENLPKYHKVGDNIVLHKYEIEEETLDNYISKITQPVSNPNATTYTAKITNTEKFSIKLKKDWQRDTGHTEGRKTVTFELLRNGEKYGEYDISGESWEIPVNDLPKYYKDETGKVVAYEYTVREISTVDNYTSSGEPVAVTFDKTKNEYSAAITNTYDPQEAVVPDVKISITVKKDWQRDDAYKGDRRTVTFKLKMNGEDYDGKYTNTITGGSWETEITGLPKYYKDTDGTVKLCTYTIVEDKIKNYGSSGPVVVTLNKNENEYEAVITNTYNPVVPNEYINITVRKDWQDDDEHTDKREPITFKLKMNGKDYTGNYTNTITAANNWETRIENLPKYYLNTAKNIVELCKYEIVEVSKVENYDSSGSVEIILNKSKLNEYEAVITNTYNPVVPDDKISITVEKAWLRDTDPNGRSTVTFKLKQNGKDYTGNYTNTITDANNWKIEIKDLPKYYVDDDKNVLPCEYEIVEVSKVKNYVSSDKPVVVTCVEDKNEYSAVVTNTYVDDTVIDNETVKIKVNKEWVNNGNTNPTSINFKLKVNGKDYDGDYTKTLSDANEWETEITGLPKYYKVGDDIALCKYEIEEEVPDNYTSKITPIVSDPDSTEYTAVITNTHKTTEKISITVEKIWDGDKGHTGDRPKEVAFKLTKNGKQCGDDKYYISGSSWKTTIKNLDKYYIDASGKAVLCKYEVEEIDEVENYDSSGAAVITLNESTNKYEAAITNTYNPVAPEDTISITVKKSWRGDTGNTDGHKPVTFKLKMNGEDYTGKYTNTITAENNWETKIEGLPKYYVDGNKDIVLCSYEIVEVSKVPNYNSSGSVVVDLYDNISNYNAVITNTYVPPTDPKPEESTPSVSEPGPNKPSNPGSGTSQTSTSNTTTASPAETTHSSDTEDVSSSAGLWGDESDPVQRDTVMIIILVGIIIAGTSILAYRSKIDDSDKKYRM